MAFNLQTFKTRALTAVIFVVVMLAGLLVNQWTFLALFSLIHFGCWIEYQKLVALIDPEYKDISPLHRYGSMLIGFGMMLWMTGAGYHIGTLPIPLIGWSLFWVGLIGFILSEFLLTKKLNPKLWAHSVLGLLYISLSWGLMMRLYGNLEATVLTGAAWVLPVLLIASIWINDTMAYLVGSFIGKTPLSPVSPKKTWEGTVGGAILAILLVTGVGVYAFDFPVKTLLLVSITASITGTLGDLFESKLKRLAQVKDSGSFMPGHGGFLDRFDSLLVATTAVWVVLYLFS
ncbi:MAG TPA: phosphatidate cytidylyltransferase [Sediminibacterium sp.]